MGLVIGLAVVFGFFAFSYCIFSDDIDSLADIVIGTSFFAAIGAGVGLAVALLVGIGAPSSYVEAERLSLKPFAQGDYVREFSDGTYDYVVFRAGDDGATQTVVDRDDVRVFRNSDGNYVSVTDRKSDANYEPWVIFAGHRRYDVHITGE
jgi:hypothetical protein